MSGDPRCWALVPAAGSGSRMRAGQPKQFLRLGDRTVLEHSLDALWKLPALTGVVLVNDDKEALQSLAERFPPAALIAAPGGAQRCHSVLNGLEVLAQQEAPETWVLVHDAARPCVRAADLEKLFATVTAEADGTGGLLAVPVCDTIKRADACGRAAATVDRNALWHAQTPQMFRLGSLRAALQTALADGYEVTDEASAMEHAGYRPLLVEGRADNIKITRPEDLALAEWYLKQQGRL
ncbi:MAG: 2-C-methyl-D-erythritol 4-phosphate cytidylyltransferase [Thiogranum sp.]|nr:2-C-methyl-D-erythritol 4-phosphate cytidylyltransferase [Thiogranum sp.]